ncbi:hypothetical protein ACIHDR_23705 [Nocardia sp. NPDC052278]|uniref:hypothetical protein n=1 Tax=unclassified Nocardia TaxID=2637762 RepID=UPI003678C8BE
MQLTSNISKETRRTRRRDVIIAKHETGFDKSLWRTTSEAAQRYLHFLTEAAGLDFTLSDVEQAAAGDIDYHDIDIAA